MSQLLLHFSLDTELEKAIDKLRIVDLKELMNVLQIYPQSGRKAEISGRLISGIRTRFDQLSREFSEKPVDYAIENTNNYKAVAEMMRRLAQFNGGFNPKYSNRTIVHSEARRRWSGYAPQLTAPAPPIAPYTGAYGAPPIHAAPYPISPESPSKKRGRPPSTMVDEMTPMDVSKRPFLDNNTSPPVHRPAAAYGAMQVDPMLLNGGAHLRFLPNTNVTLDTTDDAFYRLGTYPPLVSNPFEAPGGTNKVKVFEFYVTDDIYQRLASNQARVILRTFMVTKTQRGYASPTPSKHSWPSGAYIFVNGNYYDVTKLRRDEKKKTLEMPADITAYIKSAENKVTLQASTLMPYHVAIQVMIPVSVEDMIAHIKANCVLPFDLGKEMVLNSFKAGPDDIVEMKKKLSLYDPLVLTRIQTPGRPKTCKHVQCFDLKNYLLMNERVRTWRCPICGSDAPYDTLIVDEWMSRVLQKIPTTVSEIEMFPDSSWSDGKNKYGATGEFIGPMSTAPAARAATPAPVAVASAKITAEAFMVIDSDDEDEPAPSAPAVASVLAGLPSSGGTSVVRSPVSGGDSGSVDLAASSELTAAANVLAASANNSESGHTSLVPNSPPSTSNQGVTDYNRVSFPAGEEDYGQNNVGEYQPVRFSMPPIRPSYSAPYTPPPPLPPAGISVLRSNGAAEDPIVLSDSDD